MANKYTVPEIPCAKQPPSSNPSWREAGGYVRGNPVAVPL